MNDTPECRELTTDEIAAIRKLVVSSCANYDRVYGCLPLDCECYMIHKAWTGAFCRYFSNAVLPLNPLLANNLLSVPYKPGESKKNCILCNQEFIGDARRRYCSLNCSKKALKRQLASNSLKYRKKQKALRHKCGPVNPD